MKAEPRYEPLQPRVTTYFHGNGKRECDRRRRQIALGQLRHENGVAADVPMIFPTRRAALSKESAARVAARAAWTGDMIGMQVHPAALRSVDASS